MSDRYAARVIANGAEHTPDLAYLAAERPDASSYEIGTAYYLGGWPKPTAVPVHRHPAECACDGTGWITNPDDPTTVVPCTAHLEATA